MKKKIFAAVLSFVLVFSFALAVYADDIYEAENAKLSNSEVWIGDSDSASGKKYVGGIDPSEGYARNVEFTVNAPEDGVYKVQIAYANGGGDAKLAVFVNGVEGPEILTPATAGGWAVFGSDFVDFEVTLKKGANTLKFANKDQYTQIDYIKVSAVNTAADTTDAKDAAANPKTGDNGITLYVVLALLSGLAFTAFARRKATN